MAGDVKNPNCCIGLLNSALNDYFVNNLKTRMLANF